MNYLLPFKYKVAGKIIVATAVVLPVIFFTAGNFDNSSASQFTLLLKSDVTFRGNFSAILLIIGFALVVFSKEKNELHYLKSIRTKALTITSIIFVFWLLTSVLFSNQFCNSILLINSALPFIIYLGLFFALKKSEQTRQKYHTLQKKITQFKSKL